MAGESKEIIAALQKTVMPSSWDEQGGPASVASVLGNALVVAATDSLHEKAQDFLDKIDAASSRP